MLDVDKVGLIWPLDYIKTIKSLKIINENWAELELIKKKLLSK